MKMKRHSKNDCDDFKVHNFCKWIILPVAKKPSYATVLHNWNRENVNDIQNFDWRTYQKRAIWKTRKKYSYNNMKTDLKYPGCQVVDLNYSTKNRVD
jgi:hypothetical protein